MNDKLRNSDIREAAKAAGVKLWQVAKAAGVSDNTLTRRLREELPLKQKTRIFEIIEDLKENQESD